MTRRICSTSIRTGGSVASNRRSIRIVAEQPVVERQRLAEHLVQIRRARPCGAGIRANCANSSTSPLSDSTSPTIVAVHSSTSARAGAGAVPKCRRIRSAHS